MVMSMPNGRTPHPLEQRWRLALQNAGFGVWDLDVPRGLVHYSPQWKALLGYAQDEGPDTTATWRSRVHPDDLPYMLEALTRHLQGEDASYETEFRLKAVDGSYRWVLSRGRVVARDADGRPLRAVGTLVDLTDRRQAELMRAERDHAEAASRAKTEFLGRMSHELRTPLNAVLGFAQLLNQPGGATDPEQQRRYVQHIERAGWQLLRMVDNVLDLSHVERGKLALQPEPVAMEPVVHTAIALAQPQAEQHGVRVTTHLAPSDAVMWADSGRLRQVLDSLLDNAIRYNRPNGSVQIEVTASADDCTLAVIDTGPGIPPDRLPRLFEPFSGAAPGGQRVEGLGIGLVLARSLVRAMGGELTATSTQGVGSRFEVRLPRPPGP